MKEFNEYSKGECPIIPTESIRVNLDPDNPDNYLMVCPTHDSIQVFPGLEYNYLRYYDATDKELKAYWFDNEILADLYDLGIPITHRKSITQDEYNTYIKTTGRLSISNEVEVVELDPIEVEVQKAHQHLEAELDYYLHHEWGE